MSTSEFIVMIISWSYVLIGAYIMARDEDKINKNPK